MTAVALHGARRYPYDLTGLRQPRTVRAGLLNQNDGFAALSEVYFSSSLSSKSA